MEKRNVIINAAGTASGLIKTCKTKPCSAAPYLSILIPAYNEELRIANTIQETYKTMSNFRISHEIIIVDDGSTDNTYAEASKAALSFDNVKVIHYGQNGGKGNALRYGCRFVSGDLVTFLDADLELHPKQLPTFLEYMKKYDADIVVGSKRHPGSRIKYPANRKFLSLAYHLMVKVLFRLPISDTQLGLKLYRREVIDIIIPKMMVKRYAYDIEILANANHSGYKMVDAPIELHYCRNIGRIKIKDIFKIANDTAAIFYRLYILKYYDKKNDHKTERFDTILSQDQKQMAGGKMKITAVRCSHCGKEIYINDKQLVRDKMFCTLACMDAYKKEIPQILA